MARLWIDIKSSNTPLPPSRRRRAVSRSTPTGDSGHELDQITVTDLAPQLRYGIATHAARSWSGSLPDACSSSHTQETRTLAIEWQTFV